MKSYKELSRLGRLPRLRKLAQVVLDYYGLSEAKLTFLNDEGNVIFRVDMPMPLPPESAADSFTPNRNTLRIHSMDDTQSITSELTWLAALSRELGLPVSEPVPALGGKLLARVTTPGMLHGWVVSIMCWLDGLLGEGELIYPTDEMAATMPECYQGLFKTISRQVRKVMQAFGKGSQAYGMIHANRKNSPGCGMPFWQNTLLAIALIRHNSTMQFEHEKWRDEPGGQLLRFFNSHRTNIVWSGV